MNGIDRISGQGGFYVVSTTAAQTGKRIAAIVVNEDAVFTAFAINGTNAMTTKGLSGVTIKAGSYLPADAGNAEITAFTLASGSVIAYFA
jgi:hypothetical protein